MAEEVGIIVEAKDKASTVLKKIGDVGKKSFSGLTTSINGLPDQLGKASTALMLVQNSTSQMGGQVADAANKLTALGGIIASGGPVGVALAAGTVAIAAVSFAWNEYTKEAERAKQEQQDLNEVLRRGRERLVAMEDAIKGVSDELSFFNRSAAEAAIAKQQELVAMNELGIRRLTEARIAIEFNGNVTRKLTEEEAKRVEGIARRIAMDNETLALNKEQLLNMEELHGARLIEARDEKEVATNKRRSIEAQREELKLLKEASREADRIAAARKKRIEDAEAARERRAKAVAKSITDFQAEQDKINLDRTIKMENDKADAVEAAAKRKAEANIEMYSSLISGSAAVTTALLADGENRRKAIITGAIDIAEKVILARALEAGSGAGSAVAAIPLVGPALVPVAIASVFGIVKALIGSLPAFAGGGRVGAGNITGIPGQDNVLGLLRSGEDVVTPEERRARGGGGVVVNASITTPVGNPSGMSMADTKRWIIDGFGPALEELVQDNVLRLKPSG